MSWQVLRPQIKAVLDTIPELAEISQAPKIRFNSYPAAHVIPSENTGDYETNRENLRVYAFTVRAFYETKATTIENALLGLEQVVDKIIDAFDEQDLKGSDTRLVGIGLPSNYVFINLWAVPNRWGELSDDQLIMAEITVRVRVSVDVT
jgi:hypothetical protein